MNKKDLRRKMLIKRSKLPLDKRNILSKTISGLLYETEYYKKAETIMAFINFGSEINTRYMVEDSINLGKSIVIPITIPETKELKISRLLDYSELEIGFYNILTPKKEFLRFVDPSTIDLILVPGLIFAEDGYRIGYGGGYYDRFLSKIDPSVPKIGIGFDLQIQDKVPTDKYDIPVDFMLTEKGLRKINKS
ncbi:MAG TPA: 5-formyltetrahydrofolate cyclo-ligase [Tissierellaceae bacterium]|nr:5-formyltetrahydrofolate cyclo-ligase [Tissierellaceae bacterium]